MPVVPDEEVLPPVVPDELFEFEVVEVEVEVEVDVELLDEECDPVVEVDAAPDEPVVLPVDEAAPLTPLEPLAVVASWTTAFPSHPTRDSPSATLKAN